MKTSCKILRYTAACTISLLLSLGLAADSRAADEATSLISLIKRDIGNLVPSLNKIKPIDHRPTLIHWPESYISPTVDYGLQFVLPEPIKRPLSLETGYDRQSGLPTVTADYFLPVKAWTDKTLLLTPRVSVTSDRENYSVGAGFRHLINAETMIGVHASYDWVKPRLSHSNFLQQAVVGVELEALPGLHSDVSMSLNAYLPVNDRMTVFPAEEVAMRESLIRGAEANIGFLLPAVLDPVDIRIDAQAYSFREEATNMGGYNVSMTVAGRNGALSVTGTTAFDKYSGESYQISGSLALDFDWQAVAEGKNPFSVPYDGTGPRYDRDIRTTLFQRVARRRDATVDRTFKRIALVTGISGNHVSFSGGFPDLPNARLVVQTSQSPWVDRAVVRTDSKGFYTGRIELPTGEYKLRLVHKSSGRMTAVRPIVIE